MTSIPSAGSCGCAWVRWRSSWRRRGTAAFGPATRCAKREGRCRRPNRSSRGCARKRRSQPRALRRTRKRRRGHWRIGTGKQMRRRSGSWPCSPSAERLRRLHKFGLNADAHGRVAVVLRAGRSRRVRARGRHLGFPGAWATGTEPTALARMPQDGRAGHKRLGRELEEALELFQRRETHRGKGGVLSRLDLLDGSACLADAVGGRDRLRSGAREGSPTTRRIALRQPSPRRTVLPLAVPRNTIFAEYASVCGDCNSREVGFLD